MKLIKNKIKNSFSRAALTYDKYALVQNKIGNLMLEQIPSILHIKDILEIGSGTGNFTEKLLNHIYHKDVNFTLVDFSDEMLKQSMKKLSKKFSDVHFFFIAEDAENIGFEYYKKFDCIFSNSTFQWFFNFKETLSYYASLLNQKGFILFSIFGSQTFFELSKVLKTTFASEHVSIPSSQFIGEEKLLQFLKPLFNKIKIKEFFFKEEYDSLLALLRTIRYTGEYGMGVNQHLFLTPNKLKKMEKIYQNIFGNIVATYHFYICSGKLK